MANRRNGDAIETVEADETAETLKLTATQKQIVTSLQALIGNARGAIASVKEKDLLGLMETLEIVEAQLNLCNKMVNMEARRASGDAPVSAPPVNE